jgi:hypothetical protein
MKPINQPNPAWRVERVEVRLSQVEAKYLEGVSRRAGLTQEAYIRQSIGLWSHMVSQPTLHQKIDILREASRLLALVDIDPATMVGNVAALIEEAQQEIARRNAPPRPVGRPRKPDPEPDEAKLRYWRENREYNEIKAKMGWDGPDMPTNWDEERRYKANGHHRR